MTNGENVSALSKELCVLRKSLYAWRDQLRLGGPEALQMHRRGPKPKRFFDDATVAAVLETSRPDLVASTAAGAPPKQPAASAESALLAVAQLRIAELEQKIGRQALELDFFRAALQHIRAARQPNTGFGVMASMRSSER
jgi:transposase-like protein